MRRQQQPVGAESLETHVTGVHIPHAQCHLRQQQVGGRVTRPGNPAGNPPPSVLSLSLRLSSPRPKQTLGDKTLITTIPVDIRDFDNVKIRRTRDEEKDILSSFVLASSSGRHSDTHHLTLHHPTTALA